MVKIIRFISRYAKKYMGSIALFVLLSVITWSATIAIPYVTGNYIDTLVNVKTIKYVYSFALLVLAINILNMVVSYFLNLIHSKLNSQISYAICDDLFNHLRHIGVREFEEKDSVYLSNRITGDSSNITFFCMHNLVSVLTNSGTLVASFIILLHINVPIALGLLTLLPIYAALYLVFRKSLFNSNMQYREKQDVYMSTVSKQFQNIYYVKINVLFHEVSKRLKEMFEILFKYLYKYYKLNYIYSNLGNTILIIANVILILFGGLAVVNNTLSIGMFTILNVYFSMIISALAFFLGLAANLQEAKTSYSRLQELYNIPQEHNGKTVLSDINEIQINNLSFAYNKNRKFYNSSNIRFKKGNIYFLVGENGSGKSTFINLIVGLYMKEFEGKILFDNVDITDIDLYSARRKIISISTQEPILLCDTIYENITLGIEDIDMQEIENWLETFNIHDTIKKMPNGIHTKLSEKSANISGGEKQKFTHIRSFLKESCLMIFDEPTSALDKKSTEAFKSVLLKQKKDKIVIIITHDQSINDIADYTVSFDNDVVNCFKT